MKKCHYTHLLAATALVGFSSVAHSQTAPLPSTGVPADQAWSDEENQAGIEDIVVTAQRREERLQDVPIAITAFSAERLSNTGVTSAGDLGAVTPALTVASNQNYFQPRIRGIGTQAFGPGLENPIATYIDGVYIASAPASLLSLAGIERVEVLKGPQGTLFGRNATGGLIQVVTRDPRAGFSGNADVGYGNYNTFTANAYLNGGSDAVAGDLSIHYSHQGDGYGRNFFLNQDANRLDNDFAARSKLLIRPFDGTTIRVSGDYTANNGSLPTIRQYSESLPLLGPQTPGSPWDADSDYPSRFKFRGGGGSVRIDQDAGSIRLASITAYRKSTFNYQLDFDATRTSAFSVTNRQIDRQFSQELQLASGPGSTVTWLLGAYYFSGKGSFDPADIGFDGPLLSPTSPTFPLSLLRYAGNQATKSFAGFGQATVPLGENTNLTGGLRYTTEKRELDVTQTAFLLGGVQVPETTTAAARFNKLTWRLSLDHKFTPDVMVYASYNRGFKSGGFNVTTPLEPQYSPETLDAYEIGVKADLFGHKLRLNPSIFYYDYQNVQVQFFTNQGQIGIRSGPSARIYGLDLDFEFAPTRELRFYGGATVIHDRFGNYPNAPIAIPLPMGGNAFSTGDATGNRLPFTADFSGTIGVEYKIPLASGNLALNANLNHNSGFFSETDNQLRQPSYNMISASIGWSTKDDRFSVRAWGKNLANEAVIIQLSSGPAGVGAAYQPPRTYGITIGSKF